MSKLILLLTVILGSWEALYALTPASHRTNDAVSVSERKISIDFRINSWEIDSTYSHNSRNLRELHALILQVESDPHMTFDSIRVSGYASPDGSLPKNRVLSLRRAMSLRDYLKQQCGVPDSLMSFGENAVPWNLFREMISALEYPWRDEALRIINTGSDTDAADNTRRMNLLKRLAGGEAWRYLKGNILPILRSAYMVTTVITVREPEPVAEVVATVPTDTLAIVAQPVDTIAAPLPAIAAKERLYDRFAIKTNAAYLAAGVTNIGFEMALSPHWSIDLPLVYSPYTLARNYRMRFLYLQPEARYWLDRPLRGHFFGIHAHAGVANISLDNKDRYQTPDGFYGAGISYGYSLPLAKRWSMEFTIGAGYFHTKYDSYHNTGIPTGQRYRKGTPLNYWGIDKVGINIVYRFGHKSDKRKEVVEE